MNTYINKKISSDEEYYKLSYEILDNLSTAILILDENFNIFYKNTTASILLGASNKNPDISTLKCENLDFVSYLKKVVVLTRTKKLFAIMCLLTLKVA